MRLEGIVAPTSHDVGASVVRLEGAPPRTGCRLTGYFGSCIVRGSLAFLHVILLLLVMGVRDGDLSEQSLLWWRDTTSAHPSGFIDWFFFSLLWNGELVP